MRTALLAVEIALNCAVLPLPLMAQAKPQVAGEARQSAAKSLDKDSIEMLKDLNAKYKALPSFSADLVSGVLSSDGSVKSPRFIRIDYRWTRYLSLSVRDGANCDAMITDGTFAYYMPEGTPHEYTLLPYQRTERSPFEIAEVLGVGSDIECLKGLLTGAGADPNLAEFELQSVTVAREGAQSVRDCRSVETRHESTRKGSNLWLNRTFTIGNRDRLLYRSTQQSNSDSVSRVVEYRHPRQDATASAFAPPMRSRRLPVITVLNFSGNNIIIDKGSRDGVAVGDELRIYTDTTLTNFAGKALVTQTYPTDSEAKVTLIKLEVDPEYIGIVVKHAAGTKGKS